MRTSRSVVCAVIITNAKFVSHAHYCVLLVPFSLISLAQVTRSFSDRSNVNKRNILAVTSLYVNVFVVAGVLWSGLTFIN